MKEIDFCVQKELDSFKNKFLFKNFKLKKQETHFKICDGKLSIFEQHPIQDEIRWRFFLKMFHLSGIDIQKLNFEGIINLDDDVPDYDEDNPRICMSKRKGHGNILICDSHIFNIQHYQNTVNEKDCDFNLKLNKCTFAGSDTGVYKDARNNQRFQFCFKNKNSEFGDFKITNFVEIDKNSLNEFDWKSIEQNFIPIEEQLKFKYILNINGNTTSWDRLIWSMSSNSISVSLKPQFEQLSWYYHWLHKNNSITYIDEENWENQIKNIDTSIKLKQKEDIQFLTNLQSHIFYFKSIIEKYNILYNN